MANKKKNKRSKAKPKNVENSEKPRLPGFNEGATCSLDGVNNNENARSSVTCKVVISKAESDPVCVKKGLEQFQMNMRSAAQSTNRANGNVGTGLSRNKLAGECDGGEKEESCSGAAALPNSGRDGGGNTDRDGCEPMDVSYDVVHHQEDVTQRNDEQGQSSLRSLPSIDCPPFAKEDVTFDPRDPNLPLGIKEMLRPYVTQVLGKISDGKDVVDTSVVHSLAVNAMMKDVNGTCKRTESIPLADSNVITVSFSGGQAQDRRALTTTSQQHPAASISSMAAACATSVSRIISNSAGTPLSQVTERLPPFGTFKTKPTSSKLVGDLCMELCDEIKNVGPKQQKTTYENCVYPNCRKVSHVLCVACNRTVYCNARHQKLDKKNHERSCLPYRFIDKVGVGKYALAARDINGSSAIIIGDEPIAVFPVSPLIHVGKSPRFALLPKNYCVNCCKVFPDGSYVGACSEGCTLLVCKDKSRCFPHERGHYHKATECNVLRKLYAKTGGEPGQLAVDHNMVAVLRCVSHPLNTNNEKYLRQKLTEMSSGLKLTDDSFKARLEVYRKYLSVDTRIGDEALWRIETAIQKFGRNCVRSGFMVYDRYREPPPYQSYVKCIFQVASLVQHSCVPNCYFSCDVEYFTTVRSLKEIKKGEPLTVCYDLRSLFYPTWKRRNHLLEEFGLTCKCKRCSSSSELGTFFSAFPCSNPSCVGRGSRGRTGTAFIVPECALDSTSDWSCFACKKTKVKPIRIEFLLMTLELELNQAGYSALSLWTRIEELVEDRYLHWNHFVVFQACIKFFNLLWEELNRGDVKILTVYSKHRGLQFFKAAETVLTLTKTFVPEGYPQDYILAIRLSGVIIMRDLSDKISTETIKIEQVEATIKDIYFRMKFKFPLYRIPIPPHPQFPASSANLKVVESNAILQLTEDLSRTYGPINGAADNELNTKGQLLGILHKHKIRDDPDLIDKIRQKQLKRCPDFPWALKV